MAPTKKTEAATGSVLKKCVLKSFAIFTGKHLLGDSLYKKKNLKSDSDLLEKIVFYFLQ